MLCNRCPNVMDVRRSGIYTLSLKASVGVFTLGERSIRTRGGTARYASSRASSRALVTGIYLRCG